MVDKTGKRLVPKHQEIYISTKLCLAKLDGYSLNSS